MKRIILLLIFLAILIFTSWLVAQEIQVRVVVDKARIYAESSTESYRIETVGKGMVLTLFGAKQTEAGWFYVYYQSPRWNSKVTGFIQAEMVEALKPVGKPVEKPEAEQEVQQEEKQEEKRDVKPETKPEVEQIEQTLAVTSLSTDKSFPLPLSIQIGQNPRIFEVLEPPEPKIVITDESLAAGILPVGTKRVVRPEDKINSKIWEERVVIPDETEVPKKERDIKEPDPLEKKEQPEKRAPQIVEQKPPEITRSMPPRERSLFTFSLGYGPSLGGFGGFIQLNTAGNFSVHWGIGYYPTSIFYPDYDWVQGKAMYSVGVKYYLPWRTDHVRPFVDLQYGGISVEAVRIVTGVWYYTYVYENIQKTLWGPSLLAGLELRFGSFGLNGALGLSYVLTEWEYWDQPLFVTADVGFLLYF